MRPWLALLLLAPLMAGCNGPDDAPVDGLATPSDERGEAFGTLAAPAWRAGYRFRYETSGTTSFSYDADTPDERESGSEAESWDDEPGLHFVVLNTTQTVDGEPVYIARAASEGSPQDVLLAVRTSDLAVRVLGHGWLPCGPMDCAMGSESFSDPGLRFPLADGDSWTNGAGDDHGGFGSFPPGKVESTVLGEKPVEGPTGVVEAVHVRHLGVVDEQALRDEVRHGLAEGDAQDVEDVQVDADVSSRRDVFYAPTLRNVVLDRVALSGRMAVSYVQDGRTWSYESTFDVLVVNRLVRASFAITDEVPLAQLIDETMTAPTWPEAFLATPLQLEVSPTFVNVFDGQTVDIDASAPGSWVDVTITDAAGQRVPAYDPRTGEAGMYVHRPEFTAFQPSAPGAYLVTATAYGPQGQVQVRKQVVEAVYTGLTSATCPLVSAGNPCEELLVPMGPGLGAVQVAVEVDDPAPLPLPGDLVLDLGSDQLRASREGDSASLAADGAQWLYDDWRLWYEPEAGVASNVVYDVSVIPAPDVLERMRAEADAANAEPAPSGNGTAVRPHPVSPPAAPPTTPAAFLHALMQRFLA